MVDKQKKTLETSLTSKLIPRNDASSTQSQAKCPEASKHHESSSQESRPEGFGKKIFIKLRMQTTFSLPQDLDKLIKIEKGMLPFNAKFHPDKSYVIVEGKKVSFTVEEINDLYDLANDSDAYPGQRLIANPRKGNANNIIKLIAWPGVAWMITPTMKL
ncbi:hypothetical protein E6C27_scaffold128G00770 [Cucumis melo var. makuwa]|uniref:Uncharacterized protein n=1 Tax=Cucumis melo var. makuwa TaxID=1194695 RepID=A0A5A7TGJ0_CUCMM|nr:hypothetical protein E6C27_scaffold128G00770 [Cucumis melo var. makuwa]